jgi:hypothetical protein
MHVPDPEARLYEMKTVACIGMFDLGKRLSAFTVFCEFRWRDGDERIPSEPQKPFDCRTIADILNALASLDPYQKQIPKWMRVLAFIRGNTALLDAAFRFRVRDLRKTPPK